ncbi:MAG: flagellar basal body-associated FliL family protein [Candidatus Methylomirabilis oxygeniifera]|uniref:Flagellar protein FliL n=1 Tax=Methylomirabilis oxygeniifera TaxID=671143 RepID=D5MGC0_METO1|nr:MAG: flagellar basal body-associated FliL family protein [Candidatus Methylomirabilis oxyfera]CBE68801.1 putative Flagellar basal body-associated protein FliL [Candidatus Methylomirabilis oxyfera]
MADDAKAEIREVGGSESPGGEEKKTSAAGRGKLVAMAVQAGIVIALTGAAFGINIYVLKPMLVVNGKEQAKESEPEAKKEHHAGKILPLDPAIVNIAGTNGRRYLKVTVQIEIPEEEELVKEVEARKALLSDRLIQILSGKPLEEVTSAGSLQALKQQIADQFGKELGADRLQNVYLTEFVIQ